MNLLLHCTLLSAIFCIQLLTDLYAQDAGEVYQSGLKKIQGKDFEGAVVDIDKAIGLDKKRWTEIC
jgi:hypothetical protein